jgi:hypothetical protein
MSACSSFLADDLQDIYWKVAIEPFDHVMEVNHLASMLLLKGVFV